MMMVVSQVGMKMTMMVMMVMMVSDGDHDDDDGELVIKCLSPVRCSPSHQSASKKKEKLSSGPKFRIKHATHKLVLKEFHLDLYILGGQPSRPPIWRRQFDRLAWEEGVLLHTKLSSIYSTVPGAQYTQLLSS